MVKKVTSNGTQIKKLRTDSLSELPQKKFAAVCGISERQLRRIENDSLVVPMPVLQRIAKALGVCVDAIAYGAQRPTLATENDNVVTLSNAPAPTPEIIPRHTTVGLSPVSTAQALYELAQSSMEVIPHVLVDAPSEQMAMIKECLSLLKAVSDRRWSCGAPVTADAHDDADFPEVSRRSRLAELFVLLKGHDIRVVAEHAIYMYPPGARPWTQGQSSCFQFIIGFAPPRSEYEEEYVTVPFDGGREIVLPTGVPF
jgi:transcriptional regulator with XRE-family HTH domain